MTSLLRKILPKKKQNAKYKDKVYTKADFEETFAIPKKILSFVGIRMAHNLSEKRAKCWGLLYWLEVVNYSPGILAEIMGIVATVMDANSFKNAIEVFRMMPCLGICITGMIKSLKVKFNRSTFENLYNELREMWLIGEVTEEEHRIISAASTQLNFVIKGYYWCNNAFIISYLFPSLLRYLFRYLGYDTSINLFFKYWVPFDVFKPVFFDIMLAHQTWGALTVLWWNVTWDMLFCVFIAHITMQFELLSPRVRNLVHVPVDRQLLETFSLGKVSNESIDGEIDRDLEVRQHRNLNYIIKKHHTLIRLTEIVEEMFSFALLINFINSSMIICFCGFCCVLIENWNEFAYKSFFASALTQTWLLCWYGQKLLVSNHSLSQALYECGWYNGPKRIKSAILIMLVRYVSLMVLSYCVLYRLGYLKLVLIIKTSWSYFTLLLKFYSGNDDE